MAYASGKAGAKQKRANQPAGSGLVEEEAEEEEDEDRLPDDDEEEAKAKAAKDKADPPPKQPNVTFVGQFTTGEQILTVANQYGTYGMPTPIRSSLLGRAPPRAAPTSYLLPCDGVAGALCCCYS